MKRVSVSRKPIPISLSEIALVGIALVFIIIARDQQSGNFLQSPYVKPTSVLEVTTDIPLLEKSGGVVRSRS